MRNEHVCDSVGRKRLRDSVHLISPTAVLLGLTLLVPVTSFSTELTAEQILEKVSETYRNLISFRFAERRFDSSGYEPGSLEAEVAESKPGKIRLSNKLYLLVSNGETTWTYLRDRKQYTEVAAAPLLQEAWDGGPRTFLSSYLDLALQKGRAKLRGEKQLRIGGKEVDCYVVSFPISFRGGPPGGVGGSEELWVDKARFLVWRDEYLGPRTAGPYDGYGGIITLTLKEMRLGPIPDEVFEFVPPEGANRVESFAPNDGRQGSEIDASDPPGAGLKPFVYATGEQMPDFTLEGLDGSQVRLRDLRGKTVVLQFWASWCRPCQSEMSDVQKLYDELASTGVIVIGIDDEEPETVKSFVKKHGYPFPMLLDSKQTVHHLYGVRWAPTTVVIDRKGNLAARYIGAGGEAELRRHLEAAGLSLDTAASH